MRGTGVKPNLESEGRLRAGQSSQVRSREGQKRLKRRIFFLN